MNEPLVSVIIPVYNAEKYIDECIESILNQTYSNIEVIICDDCSKDSSWIRLKKYENDQRFILLKNDTNLHQAATRNRCISVSKGEYILLQDADDVSKENRIERLISEIEPGIDFIGSSCYCFDDKYQIHEITTVKEVYPTRKSVLWGIPHIHASMLIKRECINKIGGYRVSKHTNRGEDYDMVMRLYASGYKGKNIQDELYGYRVDRNTINRRDFRSRLDECIIRYEGFKANSILFPFGWVYILKPIFAYFYQKFKYMRRFE